MKFRKLRIAWLVAWGIACVLLIILWVRSYRATDVFPLRPFCISTCGRLVIWIRDDKSVPGGGSGQKIIYMSPESLRWMSRVTGPDMEAFEVEPFSSPTGFHLEHDYQRTVVQLPYWFLTSLFAMIASTPWLPRRFALRTLLIATTLVAVVLGLVVYAARK